MEKSLVTTGERLTFWVRVRVRIADALESLAERVRGESVKVIPATVQVMPQSEITNSPQAIDEGERLTVAQVQETLGVSRRTVDNLVKRGMLAKQTNTIAGEHGLRVYFDSRQVERLKETNTRLKPKRVRKVKVIKHKRRVGSKSKHGK